MPKDAYYFPHDAHAQDDEKILDLRAELGWKGYGVYWAIVERMRAATDYKLSYNRLKSLSMVLGVTYNWIQKFIKCCLDTGLFVLDGDEYYSLSLIRRMKKVDAKREQARSAANKRWKRKEADLDADVMRTHSGRNATGNAKETKLNQTKLNQTKEKDAEEGSTDSQIRLDFYKGLITDNCSIALESLQLQHREKIGSKENLNSELDKWDAYCESKQFEFENDSALFSSFRKWVLGIKENQQKKGKTKFKFS